MRTRFAPGWKMTLALVLLGPLTLSLGVWQLDRGDTKRRMETEYLRELTALPVAPADPELAVPFRRVKLRGRYGAEMFLVDNRVVAGAPGYWVVQVFEHEDKRRFLVNRGFVAAGSSRAELPEIAIPGGVVELIGAVWPFTGLVPLLDEDVWARGWPKRVQRMDIGRMADEAGAVAVEIRLEPGQPGVASAAPFAAVLGDARHRGYAATWFGLAITLLVAYGVFGVKNARDGQQQDNLERNT